MSSDVEKVDLSKVPKYTLLEQRERRQIRIRQARQRAIWAYLILMLILLNVIGLLFSFVLIIISRHRLHEYVVHWPGNFTIIE